MEIADVLIKVPGRLDSITYEPSHYAVTMAPALFLFIRDYLLKRSMRNLLKMIIIILSFLLTFFYNCLFNSVFNNNFFIDKL